MSLCSNCGADNPTENRFCGGCGFRLELSEGSTPLRRTVTVLFNDVVGSTALGEQLDPEVLRDVMARYVESTRVIVERYGGKVVQFMGDAVLAVFGAPVAHEDDALRAVRAAIDMRDELDGDGNADARLGTTLYTRTGINTGEILWTQEEGRNPIVVGDAINIAARLQQNAEPGEILIGVDTYRLVKDRVAADRLAGLEVKGKTDALTAWRVGSATEPGSERTAPSTPFIGRAEDLDLLLKTFERSLRGRFQSVTVFGEPGVGKSRLIDELRSQLPSDAKMYEGRCLPYGQGLTFWPIVELLQEITGIGPEDAPDAARKRVVDFLARDPNSMAVCEALFQTLGLSATRLGTEQIFWAVERALRAAAVLGPTMVLIEDLHWAEPTLLDLLDHIAKEGVDIPMMLLGTAREEIFERHSGWGGGRRDALHLRLGPLEASDSERLISALFDDNDMGLDFGQRVAEAAGGNPLFIEETVAMLKERSEAASPSQAGEKILDIPPSLQAVLMARLDQLSSLEKDLIGVAAVMGKVFSTKATSQLSGQDASPGLASLHLRGLLAPGTELFSAEPTLRFRHILIRDAAYEMLPKSVRADIHERYADWLTNELGERSLEYEEIIGFHLEQAFLAHQQLGKGEDLAVTTIASRATDHLWAAGQRALDRGDVPASLNLLARANALSSERPDLLLALARATEVDGNFTEALRLYDEVMKLGDERTQARADVGATRTRAQFGGVGGAALGHSLDGAIATFERLADYSGLSDALRMSAWIASAEGRLGEAEDVYRLALEYAQRSEDTLAEGLTRRNMVLTLIHGPTPVPEMLTMAEAHRTWARANGDRLLEGRSLSVLGVGHALQGEFDEGRKLTGDFIVSLNDMGLRLPAAWAAVEAGTVELLANEPVRARAILGPANEALVNVGDVNVGPWVALMLAEAWLAEEQPGKAATLLQQVTQTADPNDLMTLSYLARLKARHSGLLGSTGAAVKEASEAVALITESTYLIARAEAHMALGAALAAEGDHASSQVEAELAERLLSDKGVVPRPNQPISSEA